MVTTRSQSVGLLYEKAVRLQIKLRDLGMIRGKDPLAIYFGSNRPSLVTQRSAWVNVLEPRSIVLACRRDGKEYTVFAGCIHPMDKRCPACDVHPDADVKVRENFLRLRSWHVCYLWNTDDVVLGVEERVPPRVCEAKTVADCECGKN